MSRNSETTRLYTNQWRCSRHGASSDASFHPNRVPVHVQWPYLVRASSPSFPNSVVVYSRVNPVHFNFKIRNPDLGFSLFGLQ
ncbi:unnamed protein product [Ixodes persulcatus]